MKRDALRTSRRALLGAAAGAGAVAIAGAGLATREAGAQEATPDASSTSPGIATFPGHGTVTASPGTEITFRGVVGEMLGAVEVYGSESGFHSGYVETHRDRNGASFILDAPFLPGEVVTVSADLPIGPGEGGELEFTVSRPAPSSLARVIDESEPPGAELQTFRTRPDLQIPEIEITVASDGLASGHTLIAPRVSNGPASAMVVDNAGTALWAYVPDIPNFQILDLRAQDYKGVPVLTWWQGASPRGFGYGHFVMVDSSYQHVATFQVGNDFYGGDIHDFLITPQGTALVLIYQPVSWDLTPVGGAEDGAAHDGIIQEIDIETGRVWFEWHSLDHVGVDETTRQPEDGVTLDYFHINSVEKDDDGDFYCSARNTDAIYKIDGRTGDLIWRLNGSQSDFEMGEGTPFALQHDARIHPDGYLSLFDNAAERTDSGVLSRGMVLDLDEEAMTATLVREYYHPDELVSVSQANMQRLPNGNVFIGWGSVRVFSEHSEDGELLFDGRMPSGVNSYRAYRSEWVGRPVVPPDVVAETDDGGGITVYVSWNGATEVASWQVLAGDTADDLEPAGEPVPREGFETAIPVDVEASWYSVSALDAAGNLIGTAVAVQPVG